MHRLFVAVRPPPPIRQQLLALMGGISGARWQTDDQLHITLHFIGEVDSHVADDVAAALGAVWQPRFDVQLRGLGVFDRRGRPGILWAGITPEEPLVTLHNKVDQACVRAGLEPERRAYHPHITLARLKPGAGSMQHLLESAGGVTSQPFEVESFGLYESTLTPGGPIYSLAQTYPLG